MMNANISNTTGKIDRLPLPSKQAVKTEQAGRNTALVRMNTDKMTQQGKAMT